MERLTGNFEFPEKEAYKDCTIPLRYDFYRKIYNKLKRYEDLGKSPEELSRLFTVQRII